MGARHLSLRLDADTYERLDARSRSAGQTRSEVARTLLDEGLRMEAHPGIAFRSGPSGRRPGVAGGPDVWEIARVFQGTGESGEDAVLRVAGLTGVLPGQARIALAYYAEYAAEIDDWIRKVDEEADRAEAAWRRTRDVLRR